MTRQAIIAAVLAVLMPGSALGQPLLDRDIYVIDGDTIRVSDTTYRLVGFDTPETWQPRCEYERVAGEAATDRLRAFIQEPRSLELVILPGLDRYDRNLARLLIDGIDAADLMVNAGLARRYDGAGRETWCAGTN